MVSSILCLCLIFTSYFSVTTEIQEREALSHIIYNLPALANSVSDPPAALKVVKDKIGFRSDLESGNLHRFFANFFLAENFETEFDSTWCQVHFNNLNSEARNALIERASLAMRLANAGSYFGGTIRSSLDQSNFLPSKFRKNSKFQSANKISFFRTELF